MTRFLTAFAAFLFLAQPALAEDAPELDPENTLYLELDYGRVVIQMRPDWAPQHVTRIKELARDGFYDGIIFHRVIHGFMAQTGDPTGTGRSGSGQNIPAEFHNVRYTRGSVGMARGPSPDSGDSQFFICFTSRGCGGLTGEYTLWGEVISGMEHVDRIQRGEPPRNPDVMRSLRVAADVEENVILEVRE